MSSQGGGARHRGERDIFLDLKRPGLSPRATTLAWRSTKPGYFMVALVAAGGCNVIADDLRASSENALPTLSLRCAAQSFTQKGNDMTEYIYSCGQGEGRACH